MTRKERAKGIQKLTKVTAKNCAEIIVEKKRDRDVEDDFDSHPDVGEGKRLKQGPGSDIHASDWEYPC